MGVINGSNNGPGNYFWHVYRSDFFESSFNLFDMGFIGGVCNTVCGVALCGAESLFFHHISEYKKGESMSVLIYYLEAFKILDILQVTIQAIVVMALLFIVLRRS